MLQKLLEKLQYINKRFGGFQHRSLILCAQCSAAAAMLQWMFWQKNIVWSLPFLVKLGCWVFWPLNKQNVAHWMLLMLNVAQQKTGVCSYREHLLGEILSLFKTPECLCALENVTKSWWIVNRWIMTKKYAENWFKIWAKIEKNWKFHFSLKIVMWPR